MLRSVGLDKGTHAGIEGLFANLGVDVGAKLAPTINRRFEAEGLRILDRAVKCDPCHHLRIGKVLTSSADLPDTLVRRRPYLFEVGQKRTLEVPSFCENLNAAHARLVKGVHDLAKDVEL